MRIERLVADNKQVIALLAILLVTTVAYLPGLKGPFVFDDQHNITFNPYIAIVDLDAKSLLNAALSNDSGLLKRPLPTLTFALNHYFAEGFTNTLPYKVTNLLIHLVSTSLVYWLSALLLRLFSTRTDAPSPRLQPWLPALISAAWALHPLQLTSVLYVVQRMTSLSALFVLAGLIAFIYGRLRVEQGRRYGFLLMSAGLLAGLSLGLASKENAALLPLFILLIEFVFFRNSRQTISIRSKLGWYYGLTVLLPCLVALGWLAFHPEFISKSYLTRDFTLAQRLFTEARVLWFYLSLILFPRSNALGIYHDDIPVSSDLMTPWTTLPAVCGVALFPILAVFASRRYPVFSFSILWFLIGHSVESGVIGLEIAHEHRNYLPSYGVIFGALYGFVTIATRSDRVRLAAPLLVVGLAIIAFVTHTRAHIWRTEDGIIEAMAQKHPNSARSQYMLAELYALKKADPIQALIRYKKAAELDPSDASALVKMVVAAANTSIQNGPDRVASAGMATASMTGLPHFVAVGRIGDRISLILDETIIKEIERRLMEKPIRPMTGYALGVLSRCITQGQKNCRHLYQKATDWYRLTLENPHTGRIARSHLANSLATLHLEYGHYGKALHAVKRSKSFDPGNADHVLLEANVYIHLERLDKAEKIIHEMKGIHPSLSPDLLRETDLLLAEIRSRRVRKSK